MSNANHLQQTQLPSAAIARLHQFGEWLRTAQFQSEGAGSQRCVDSGLSDKIGPLLSELGISSLLPGQKWGYIVWRVSGPSPARFRNTPGPAYLYPIHVFDGTSPTISGLPLRVGEVNRIEQAVEVSPSLDCLFVVTL